MCLVFIHLLVPPHPKGGQIIFAAFEILFQTFLKGASLLRHHLIQSWDQTGKQGSEKWVFDRNWFGQWLGQANRYSSIVREPTWEREPIPHGHGAFVGTGLSSRWPGTMQNGDDLEALSNECS